MTNAHRRRHPAMPSLIRVFTKGEKKGLVGHLFNGVDLDRVDFSEADLRAARFVNASLRGCDFSATDLQGAQFLRSDLRGARFAGAKLESNRFEESWLSGASGLSKDQRAYIQERGGSFIRVVDNKTTPYDDVCLISDIVEGNESKPRG